MCDDDFVVEFICNLEVYGFFYDIDILVDFFLVGGFL